MKIKKTLKIVRKNVQDEISAFARRDDFYAPGLASEGYSGGYRDAIDDVMLLLNDVMPQRRDWWPEERNS